MTIGNNMPFKLKMPSVVHAKAKEEAQSDLKEMAGTNELQPDFGSLLKAVKPMRNGDPKQSFGDEKDNTESKELHDSETSVPTAQGLFNQPIIALEKMLDRRQHDEAVLMPAATTEEANAEGKISPNDSGDVRPSVDSAEIRQEVEATALPVQNQSQSWKATEFSALPHNSSALPKSAQAESDPTQQSLAPETQPEIKTASRTVSPIEAETEKSHSSTIAQTSLQEVAATPDNKASQQAISSLPQATVKPSAANILVPAASVSHPAVADIQIISDRTTGAARTLVIQLQPVELGTVTARLRLTSDGMHIQIAAASASMAEHLSNDREALGKALHRAGVTEDASNVTISIVDRSPTAAGSNQTGQQNIGGQDPQQFGGRANSQGQSGFQNRSEDQLANQPLFEDVAVSDDHAETLKKATHINSMRGLVV